MVTAIRQRLYESPSGLKGFVPINQIDWLKEQPAKVQDDWIVWYRYGGDEPEA
jgi:hypothetical protein